MLSFKKKIFDVADKVSFILFYIKLKKKRILTRNLFAESRFEMDK